MAFQMRQGARRVMDRAAWINPGEGLPLRQCTLADISDSGARLVFSSAVTFPDVVEVYLSNKEDVRRARVQWRRGNEAGVDFIGDNAPDAGAPTTDLLGRVLKLETECASLKRTVRDLRAELRKLNADETV